MEKIRFVGLDVHKETIALAVAEGAETPTSLGVMAHDISALVKRLKKLAPVEELRVCYEAGPTGFGLARALESAGIRCQVVAPSLVPKSAGDRVKTDRRDAVKLARFLRSGDLTPIHIPDGSTEAMRDLERARDAAKRAQLVARNQLLKFLLRHGLVWSGRSNWSLAHYAWLRQLRLEHEAQRRVLVDHLHAVEEATARVERLSKDIADLVGEWVHKPLVDALQAFRGIQLLSAVTLVAELGEVTRFSTASGLMSYVGLVPSEHSSGERTRRGAITKAGNRFARRILVEAAWHYRRLPRKSPSLHQRSKDLPDRIQAIAWKAQTRLYSRYRKLKGRGKSSQKAITAMARELAGFVWAVLRETLQPRDPLTFRAA